MRSHEPVDDEWWRELFDTEWTRIYAYKQRDARREAAAVARILKLPPGSQILDVACGNGRISLALARLGYLITGLDFSETLLKRGAAKAGHAGLYVNWVRGDMRDIGIFQQFDAAVSMFTSFGYFQKEDDDFKALQSVSGALKNGGQFIIDLENAFFAAYLARLHGGESLARQLGRAGGWVEEVMNFEAVSQRVTLDLRLSLPRAHSIKKCRTAYRAYTFPEMQKLLEKAGFAIQHVYGNFGLKEYTLKSERMIIISRKIR